MDFRAVAGLFCGVGIFLFSVVQMSESMKTLFESRAEFFLRRLSKNRFSGVLCGAGLTAVVQSSAAVTVTAVSLADCGKLSLSSCVGIIMGSNIGTTVTGVLAALDFSFAAPFLIVFGAFFSLISKSEKFKSAAFFLCALGLLFVGIDTMKEGARKLNENGILSALFLRFSSKLSGVLIGFFSTAVAQSSSATVGVLQSLVSVGAIKRENAVFIICGQNIGATVPTLLSSAGSNEKAKAAAVFHLLFNLLGTAGVLFLSLFFPLSTPLSFLKNGESFVSAVHVFFNVFSTAAIFPFSVSLTRFSEKVVLLSSKKKSDR